MDFSKLDGLIPAVVQDYQSGEVLMVGFMNEEAWNITRSTGYVTFFSRTRNTLWTKGETSGNRLAVRDVLVAALTALIAALDVAALYLTALLLEARW